MIVIEKHGRFWGLTGNTIKRDCLGLTKYTDNQKGTKFERKVRFELVKENK